MEDFLRKSTIINLMSTVLFLMIGIVLLTSPVTVLAVIVNIVEIILIVMGIVTIVSYVRVDSKNDVFSCGFAQGVICILLALFLIVNPNILISILPIVIGIWMVFGSLTRIQVAIKLDAWGQKANIWYIILALLMFTVGIVIICKPFATAALMVQVLGAGIIAYAILDIIEAISILSMLRKIK